MEVCIFCRAVPWIFSNFTHTSSSVTLPGPKSHHGMALRETASSCLQVQGPGILETNSASAQGPRLSSAALEAQPKELLLLSSDFRCESTPGLGTLSSFGKTSEELYPPHKAQQQSFLLPEAAFCFSWGWMARTSLFPTGRQASPEQAVLACT